MVMQAAKVDPELEQRFDELAAAWIRERGGASIRVHDHPAYAEILAMGEPAIPLILRHLRDGAWHWHSLLSELSGENPVPLGEFDREHIREFWLKWGEERGMVAMEVEAMGAVPEVSPEIEQRFLELVEQWRNETRGDGVGTRTLKHPSYLEILEMGPPAVPLILRDLAAGGGFWIGALAKLTGEDPVPAAERGRNAKMREAWLAWGRAHGLIE